MITFLLIILFIAFVGNVLISIRYKSDVYEYLLLSLILGPVSWMLQLRKVKNQQANGNL